MVALQLYIIQQRVSLVCAKFRICSFIGKKKKKARGTGKSEKRPSFCNEMRNNTGGGKTTRKYHEKIIKK